MLYEVITVRRVGNDQIILVAGRQCRQQIGLQRIDLMLEAMPLDVDLRHFQVFLGLEGDIARYGATRSNHWFFESWDTNDAIWNVITSYSIHYTKLYDNGSRQGSLG